MIFKCKMCGGDLQIQQGATVAECESCGTVQTLPKLDNERKANLFDRANHFRRNNEYDKAMSIYEQLLRVGDNLRFTARIESYIHNSELFMLDPISTETR